MKITFYDMEKFTEFYNNIHSDFFPEPFDLFGQRVMINTLSVYDNPSGGIVELDIVQVEQRDIALSAFSIKNIDANIVQATQEKLAAALNFLGERHVLAVKVNKIKLSKNKRSY